MPAAPLFCSVAHALHIAIVIVGPYEGDILRHTQTSIIDVERFLVGYKDLLNHPSLPVLVFLKDVTLLGKDLLQRTGTVLGIGATLHRLVV